MSCLISDDPRVQGLFIAYMVKWETSQANEGQEPQNLAQTVPQ